MLMGIARGAYRLDAWLQARLGRPYNALLGVGLVIEIVRGLSEIPERFGQTHRLVGHVLTMALEAALLLHQVGALSHHFERRKDGGRS
jgi:hypothetical protein